MARCPTDILRQEQPVHLQGRVRPPRQRRARLDETSKGTGLMVTNFSTKGGLVTRSETFIKLLHHLDEARDCAAVIAHLHKTEDSDKDRVLAMGWLAVAELLKRMRE